MKRSLVAAISLIVLVAGGLAGCDGLGGESASEPTSKPISESTSTEVDSSAIVETLGSDAVSDDKRLEAIYEAREAKVEQAAPALRKLLNSENPEIVVAAAAALDGLDAKEAGGDVVEAASRLSRDQKFEYLRQLLFIIGDIGGPEARIYMETVAEGHQVPAIRLTAAQVLEDMEP